MEKVADSSSYFGTAAGRRYCIGDWVRHRIGLPILAGKERKDINARVDSFRGHHPPSRSSTHVAMVKLNLFVVALFVAIVHAAAIGLLAPFLCRSTATLTDLRPRQACPS